MRKLQELGVMQREVQEFQQTRERQLSEQSARPAVSLVEEINKVVSDVVEAQGYDLVFDKSGQSLNAVNVLVQQYAEPRLPIAPKTPKPLIMKIISLILNIICILIACKTHSVKKEGDETFLILSDHSAYDPS
jgi:hypothetical protein